MAGKIIKIIKNNLIENYRVVVPIVLFPLLLIIVYIFLPEKGIGSKDGWLSFLGGYFGGIISVSGIWLQITHSEKRKKRNFISYIRYILKTNLNVLENNEIIKMYQYSLNYMIVRGGDSENKYILNFSDKYIEDNLDTIISNKNADLIFDIYRKIEGFYQNSKNHFEIGTKIRDLMVKLENSFTIDKDYIVYENFRLLKLISSISEKYNLEYINDDAIYTIKEINLILNKLGINIPKFNIEDLKIYKIEKSAELINISLTVISHIINYIDDINSKQELKSYISYCSSLNGRLEKIRKSMEILEKNLA